MKIKLDKKDFYFSLLFGFVVVFVSVAIGLQFYFDKVGHLLIDSVILFGNFLMLHFETTLFFMLKVFGLHDVIFLSAILASLISWIFAIFIWVFLFYLSTRLFKGKKFLIRFSIPLILIAIEIMAVIYTAMLYYHGAL